MVVVVTVNMLLRQYHRREIPGGDGLRASRAATSHQTAFQCLKPIDDETRVKVVSTQSQTTTSYLLRAYKGNRPTNDTQIFPLTASISIRIFDGSVSLEHKASLISHGLEAEALQHRRGRQYDARRLGQVERYVPHCRRWTCFPPPEANSQRAEAQAAAAPDPSATFIKAAARRNILELVLCGLSLHALVCDDRHPKIRGTIRPACCGVSLAPAGTLFVGVHL